MSWIDEIDEENADDKLEEVYNRIKGDRGKLSNIMKVHSLMPQAMDDHMDLYMSIMFKERSLSREMCELIGVVVSNENGCEYCVNHHAEALNHYWDDEERIERLKEDYKGADLDDKKSTIVEYAVKLTNTPDKVEKVDVDNLRRAGFSDKNILNINLVTSYFNFVNRIALGLGVEFSQKEVKGYDY
ncbi:MAG: peroxidase-related enzyme [Thermoplasmatota archaeon]